MTETVTGRVAQRRRTRRAIVEAASRLLADGIEPTVAAVAAEADVSRRTIYLYFPTLDQLLLDATIGAMSIDVDGALDALDAKGDHDPHRRLAALIGSLYETMEQTLPLGRRLIKLTVDAAVEPGTPKRGYRRLGWIERAISPIRSEMGKRAYEDLVSSLSLVIGWEPYIVLGDVRGLDHRAICRVTTSAANDLVDSAMARAVRRG